MSIMTVLGCSDSTVTTQQSTAAPEAASTQAVDNESASLSVDYESYELDNGLTAEITRLCASPGAPKNACSFLYGRCWRIWQQMGGKRMITYTFRKESGGSIRATGWRMIGATRGFGDHLKGWRTRPNREKQENVKEPKYRWEITKK